MFDRADLLAQARRRYEEFLRAVVGGAALFPLNLRIGKTRRAESYSERVAELAEFREAAATLHLTVEWRTVNDPRFGPHERPERAFFADETAFLGSLGKTDEARCFREDVALIRAECLVLESWLAGNVRAVIQHRGDWPALLRVVRWFCDNPRSGLYLRQLPVEGVDTKFFETRTSILDALLLLANPVGVDVNAERFEQRHGLRWEQPLIRLRFLDPLWQAARGFPVADLAVPAPIFRQLALSGATVVITENLRNFLALPELPGGVAVQGSGDAAALLADAPWLAASQIFYWGDLDARGLAILARLRCAYSHITSLLMDEATLSAWRHLAVAHDSSDQSPPSGLHPDERRTLERLLAARLRLEQERIPYAAVIKALRFATAARG